MSFNRLETVFLGGEFTASSQIYTEIKITETDLGMIEMPDWKNYLRHIDQEQFC